MNPRMDFFLFKVCVYACGCVRVCICLVYTYVYHKHSGICEGQKRIQNSLKLDLQAVVICHAGAGDPTELLCESSKC